MCGAYPAGLSPQPELELEQEARHIASEIVENTEASRSDVMPVSARARWVLPSGFGAIGAEIGVEGARQLVAQEIEIERPREVQARIDGGDRRRARERVG